MTAEPVEIHRLSPSLTIWHRYDPQVKAELFSTAIATSDGLYLVDPIALDEEALESVTNAASVAGIVVTNSNHPRAAALFAERFSAPIHASKSADIASAIPLRNRDRLADLQVIAIDGAASGEVALYSAADGGTIIIGDALINFGSHSFSFLPAKYCSNHKLMRRSLRKLLDFPFERMLFAHGTPIANRAQTRLTTLLDENE